MQNTLFYIKFTLFFFGFVYKSAEVERSALFYVSFLSVFLKNPKKMASFWENKRHFLKKNHVFLCYFPVIVAPQRIRS